MDITKDLKVYLDELIPKVFSGLYSLGYDEVSKREECFPTLGTIYIYEIIASKLDRKIEMSLHSNISGPNGRLFFRIKRLPKEEKGYIYNDLHITANVSKYKVENSSKVSQASLIEHLTTVEKELFEDYAETLNGKAFKPDKINYRQM